MFGRRSFLSSLGGFLFGSQTNPSRCVYAGKLKICPAPKLRVWTLGDLDNKIIPAAETIEKLRNILAAWDGKSDLDLVWGPDLKVQQFNLTTEDVDAIIQPGEAQIESMVLEEDGSVLTKVLLKKPLVRIVRED